MRFKVLFKKKNRHTESIHYFDAPDAETARIRVSHYIHEIGRTDKPTLLLMRNDDSKSYVHVGKFDPKGLYRDPWPNIR